MISGATAGLAAAAEATPQVAASLDTPLTPDLATLAEPSVAAAPEAQQAEAMELPVEGPGSLVREGGDVVVEAHLEDGALVGNEAFEAAGATVLEASARYQTVALAVAPEDLGALAEVPGLETVAPSFEPVFYGAEEEAGGGAATSATASATPNELCEGGVVTSQAMTQLNVAAARGVFGARGAGQTIGVISDSFDTATKAIGGGPLASFAADDEVTNDLPGPSSTCSGQQVPVNVIAEGPAESTDEGRAMLQVIHDLAPHAELAFATAYSTEVQFAKNIERLALTGGGRWRRGERDRRRRRLLRRALLPGRPGRGGDQESDRSRRHLPDRGGQRQPERKRDRQRNRLLGTVGIPSPPNARPKSRPWSAWRPRKPA